MKSIALTAYSLFFFTIISFTTNAQSCECEVSDRFEKAYDELLKLSEREKRKVEDLHLPYGTPAVLDDEMLLHQDEFIINYNQKHRVPMWVAYKLDLSLFNYNLERKDCFRRDIRLSQEISPVCDDYDEPIYDRGHMVPAADLKISQAAIVNSTILTNIAPQHDKFNRYTWRYLEDYVRDVAKTKGVIYVITGSVFDRDEDFNIDATTTFDLVQNKRVAVPTHFYKILVHERPNGFLEVLSVLLPNEDKTVPYKDSPKYFKDHIIKIEDIEKVTGYDFFHELQDNKEYAVENYKAEELWPTSNN